MLKKRIIPLQLLFEGRLVKSISFDSFRDVGDPVKSSSVYNSQYGDELMLLNIDRSDRGIQPLIDHLDEISQVCFMPLTVGGGIQNAENAATLLASGADKILINSINYRDLSVTTDVAKIFGAQAIVAGVDCRWDDFSGTYTLFSDLGRCKESVDLETHIKQCQDAGAGEILIQSIDNDGRMKGYDIRLIEAAMAAARVPVVAAGGSGNYEHLKDAFLKTDVSGLGCGSLFNFSDSNPIRAKAFLTNYGLPFKVV